MGQRIPEKEIANFAFVEAVTRKNYGLKQAYANGKAASTVAPFFGIRCAG